MKVGDIVKFKGEDPTLFNTGVVVNFNGKRYGVSWFEHQYREVTDCIWGDDELDVIETDLPVETFKFIMSL